MSTARSLLELGAVLFALGALGRLAGRFGLSPIPLYLLAGLAFGTGGLLPLEAPEGFFATGSQVGVVLLLLVLGLEYTADELITNLRRQAPVGVLDLLLNGLPGAALALMLGWGPTAALAMFGVTAISSSGIVSKVLTDLGRLGNRETPAILSVLVIEDLAMAVYLPVLTALVAASTLGSIASSVLIALGMLAVVLTVALRGGDVVTRFVGARSDEVLLLRVLGLALLVAGAAEALHVSSAVGAFLLGIALSGEVADACGEATKVTTAPRRLHTLRRNRPAHVVRVGRGAASAAACLVTRQGLSHDGQVSLAFNGAIKTTVMVTDREAGQLGELLDKATVHR